MKFEEAKNVAYAQGMVEEWTTGSAPKQVQDAVKMMIAGYDQLRKEIGRQEEEIARQAKLSELQHTMLNTHVEALKNGNWRDKVELASTLQGTVRCVVNPGTDHEIWAGNPYKSGNDKFLALPPFRIYIKLDELFAIAQAIKEENNLPVHIEGWSEPIDKS